MRGIAVLAGILLVVGCAPEPSDGQVLATVACQYFADYYRAPPGEGLPDLRNAAGAARAAAREEARWKPLADDLATVVEGADELDPDKVGRMAKVADRCSPLLAEHPWP